MAHPSRRYPQQKQTIYSVVPQSPRSASASTSYNPSVTQRAPAPQSQTSLLRKSSEQRRTAANDTAHGVQTGHIGGGYGPYSYQPGASRDYGSRFSNAPSEVSSVAHEKPTTTTVPHFLLDSRDPDLDDALHNPDPVRDAALDRSFTLFSARGWANASVLILLVAGLITLFGAFPIIAHYRKHNLQVPGFNLGGINATGQVPSFPQFPNLIDNDTPDEVKTRVGNDGKNYRLVFSDEFNVDGRSFFPGDDPYWEAQDLHYWATGDLEWYDPQAVTTKDGKLVITMSEQSTHDLNFQSGMLSSWNKWCFTTGYIEVSISLPGNAQTPGFWPAAWTMGNLGRAGYGATTEGMWPYSYDSCDVGTFPNQTDHNGNPAAAAGLSFLPGQRLSACTCPKSDHPGPSTNKGRGVPEIDILEAQIDTFLRIGEVSQSAQIAPYNNLYQFNNETPATTIYNDDVTHLNSYQGGIYQQALSGVSKIDSANYGGNKFASYGFEWWSDPKHRDQGFITWISEGVPTWQVTAASMGPDPITQVSQRLVSEEPHYIIFNLGMSPGFQAQDFKNLQFPAQMLVDYVRVYQRDGVSNTGCNPSDHPTTDYINNHAGAYTNPNHTTWAEAGYTFPRNSLFDGC